ncbi:MAG: hypothetical protein GYB68_07540 [Chloroflexi bacterium]|nr:hypothetical protein [Chloroflexota bacterium]
MSNPFFNPPIQDSVMAKRSALKDKGAQVMLSFPRASLKERPEHLTEALSYCKEAGRSANWVQIIGGSAWSFSPLSDYPDLDHQVDDDELAEMRKLIEICRAEGAQVAWMSTQWAPPPQLFEKYPQTQNLQTGAFWSFVERAIREAFAQLDLDEITASLFERPGTLFAQPFFRDFNYGEPAQAAEVHVDNWPYLSFADHVRLLLQAAARACHAQGKTFAVFSGVSYPFQEQLLIDALTDWPSDLPILLEHPYSNGDFNPWFPPSRLLSALPHLSHGLVSCGGLQSNGLGEIPFCFPELMQQHVLFAHEATPHLRRLGVRPVWAGKSLIKTPNEVNLEVVLRLAENPLLDTDQLWLAWATRRYNELVAEDIADILRPTDRANMDTFFTFGVKLNDRSRLPDFEALQRSLINDGKAYAAWAPTPSARQDVYELVVAPNEKTIRRMNEKHGDALMDIEESLAKIRWLEDKVSEEDYQQINQVFLDFKDWVTLHIYQIESYIWYRMFLGDQSERNRQKALESLDNLEIYMDYVSGARPEASELVDREALKRFAVTLKERLMLSE